MGLKNLHVNVSLSFKRLKIDVCSVKLEGLTFFVCFYFFGFLVYAFNVQLFVMHVLLVLYSTEILKIFNSECRRETC